MTETAPQTASIEGNVYLYEKPEILSKDQHAGLGLSRVERPFDFVAGVRMLPVTVREFAAASKIYPIVFADNEDHTPLAVTGLEDNDNLFVSPTGQWEPFAYIPAYLRRYPFNFAGDKGADRFALVIDRAAKSVSDSPDIPFFENGELTESTQQAVEFCRNYEVERQMTLEFTKKLNELGLFAKQEARYRPTPEADEQTFAAYTGIDEEKLRNLDKDVYIDLRDRGYLPFMYGQLFSNANWRTLLERRAVRQQTPANQA